MIDADRFGSEPGFRSEVLPSIAAALPDGTPADLRDQLLLELSGRLDLYDLASVERAWGVAPREINERLVGADERAAPGAPVVSDWPELRLGEPEAPIGLSIYSLASRFFSADEATTFLEGLRRWDPERAIVVLTDYQQSLALTESAARLGIQLSQTWSRSYSPWPRDPMSFLALPTGAQVAVLRPNRQPGREADSLMGLELIQELPAELDDRFGPLTWTVAPIPFHNGHLLPAGDEIWLSIHTLEQRILQLLRVERVPAESFARLDGVARYVEAARLAAGEVERLFGKPARFVHPLPLEGTPTAEEAAAAIQRLGGGAGFDLDSLVTLLPLAADGPTALVADLSEGIELARAAADAELERFRAAYRLTPAPDQLRSAIDLSHRRPRATLLGDFLELVARHLSASGFAVRRLPLLLVPTALLERADDYPDEDFLVGWNNVVLQSSGRGRRAEGFAALLASGDARASAQFAAAGYQLELLPPLVESVLRNGGYRCASNHIRYSKSRSRTSAPGNGSR